MTTIFVYEYCTAIGLGRHPSDPAHSLWREGHAMRDAIVADFRAVPNVTVRVLELPPDDRDEQAAFVREVAASDFTLVIAPELNDELQRRCDWVRETGGRLLGCNRDAMAVTSDKLALAKLWTDAGVPTPRTVSFRNDVIASLRFPIVCKPVHGVGSTATFRFDDPQEFHHFRDNKLFEGFDEGSLLLQEFAPGRSAGVALLIGSGHAVALLPAFQTLSDDNRFRYTGGVMPIPDDLAGRAVRLARRATDAVSGLLGYVGVDLILGAAADGSEDVAIEINPRLTTSYVGLRQLADFNIALAMMAVVVGNPRPKIRWKPGRVRFGADGSVTVSGGPEPGILET